MKNKIFLLKILNMSFIYCPPYVFSNTLYVLLFCRGTVIKYVFYLLSPLRIFQYVIRIAFLYGDSNKNMSFIYCPPHVFSNTLYVLLFCRGTVIKDVLLFYRGAVIKDVLLFFEEGK